MLKQGVPESCGFLRQRKIGFVNVPIYMAAAAVVVKKCVSRLVLI